VSGVDTVATVHYYLVAAGPAPRTTHDMTDPFVCRPDAAAAGRGAAGRVIPLHG